MFEDIDYFSSGNLNLGLKITIFHSVKDHWRLEIVVFRLDGLQRGINSDPNNVITSIKLSCTDIFYLFNRVSAIKVVRLKYGDWINQYYRV